VAVFLGGGALAAMAATGTGPIGSSHAGRPTHRASRVGLLGRAARYLDVSPARLKSDLRSGRTLGQVANSTAGKSQAGLIQALEAPGQSQLAGRAAILTRRVEAQVKRPYGPAGLARGALFNARRYLGLSATQLRGDRRAGMSLAQIADATAGRSQAGLVQALVSARTQALAAAVSARMLTGAQEQARLARLTTRVTTLVDRRPRAARRRHTS
jgi:hypothetical protein